MAKLTAGFLCGVLATIAVLYLLNGKSHEIQERLTGQSALPEEMTEEERSITEKRFDEVAERAGEE